MNILNRYVTKDFLLTFFVSILILTFVMLGANMIKALDAVSRGISLWDFCKFMAIMLPSVLTFTIPWAVLAGVVLVFGRLSSDNEITAMRACGVSILQIVSPILIFTFLLCVLCLYIQMELGPPLLGKSRSLLRNAVTSNPMVLFTPGQPIEYEDTIIYVDERKGKDELCGIQLYRMVKENGKTEVAQDVSARSGKIIVNPKEQIMKIVLYDCLISDKVSDRTNSIERLFNKEMEVVFPYGNQLRAQPIVNREKYMRFADLMARIRLLKQNSKNPSTVGLEIELNQRVAFSLAPIAFLLLGLPMVIRSNRRETNIGIMVSVVLSALFFLLMILCESLESIPQIYPQYLIWLPNIIFQLLGAYLTYRVSQK